MLKRISILTLIVFSTLVLAALAPFSASASVPAQDATVAPTIIVPTVVVTTVSTTVVVPVTGTSGTPLSTLLIIGLLIVLGFAIIVGGMAMSRRPVDEDIPHDHHHH
jgi:hypothetical protein